MELEIMMGINTRMRYHLKNQWLSIDGIIQTSTCSELQEKMSKIASRSTWEHNSGHGGKRWSAMKIIRITILVTLVIILVSCAQTTSPSEQAAPTQANPPQAEPERIDWTNKDLQFENLSNDDGLSQSVVNAIIQDQHGFIWLATQDGLNRFDGIEFQVFKNDPTKPNSISNNFICMCLNFF